MATKDPDIDDLEWFVDLDDFDDDPTSPGINLDDLFDLAEGKIKKKEEPAVEEKVEEKDPFELLKRLA